MPVILNLIKESLKPVTQEAEGGHAIAPVLLFLLFFYISESIFQDQLVPCFSCNNPALKGSQLQHVFCVFRLLLKVRNKSILKEKEKKDIKAFLC